MTKIIMLILLASYFNGSAQVSDVLNKDSATTYPQSLNFSQIDSLARVAMHDFDVPGMAIGIVRNDSLVFAKGYGTKSIGEDRAVDANTIFGIGSISKSFTALTLALLADDGKLSWDDRVKDYLPYFELYDPYVTENFTIRDLLTHRSGLAEQSGGTLWYHSNLSREEIIKRLKYLKPVSGFRDKPAYQNVMFLVASEIVKKITGMEWDDFLRQRIFDKTKMPASTSRSSVREMSNNIALPHIFDQNGKKITIRQETGDNMAPAGFLYSSIADMSNYIRLLLNDGVFSGDTIISATTLHELFKPQIIYAMWPPPVHNAFTSYGFGWWLTPMDGHLIIDHSGGIDGMVANLVMVKDLNLGIIVLANTDELAPILISFKFLEQVLGNHKFDLYTAIKRSRDSYRSSTIDEKKSREKEREPGTHPSLKLGSYAGVYSDRMYGDIFIDLNKDDSTLSIRFSHTPLFSANLKHWQHETFFIDWYDTRMPKGFLTFNFDASGKITGFSIGQPRLLDVDFDELEIRRKKD